MYIQKIPRIKISIKFIDTFLQNVAKIEDLKTQKLHNPGFNSRYITISQLLLLFFFFHF